MDSQNLLRKISVAIPGLRKSEVKVADYVLQHSADVIGMRIVDLANEAEVSEPTVIRFCRAVGFDGFKSFKLQLAQTMGSGGIFTQFSVDDKDTIEDLSHKVFDTTIGSLLTVRDELDPAVLERAIGVIAKANRVWSSTVSEHQVLSLPMPNTSFFGCNYQPPLTLIHIFNTCRQPPLARKMSLLLFLNPARAAHYCKVYDWPAKPARR